MGRSHPFDPTRERLHELLQKFVGAVVDELVMFIEELVGIADISFGLLHGADMREFADVGTGNKGLLRLAGCSLL